VLLLIGAGVGVSQWRASSTTPIVQTIRVRLPDIATTQPSMVVLNATGYINASHKIELASKVIGRVAWVGVEMGDKVKKGQELVRLEDDEFKAHVDLQQGQLSNAKAKLAMAEADWKRAETIGPSEALARQQYDQYKFNYEVAKADVATSQAGLALAQLDLNNTVIKAPIDCTVLARNVELGEFVTTGFVGDQGAKGFVVSIADLKDLRVELDISQNDFAKVAWHQPCWITTDAYPDRKYDGVVDLISPEANRQKATIEVRVKILAPDDLLKPDMNATVAFLSVNGPATTQSAQTPVPRVPATAVHDGAVFVMEGGKAVRRAVVTGRAAASGEIEIKKGLIGGEDLIINPPPTLQDGDKVKVLDAKS
jgi:HlyD family secretion protein